MRIISVTYPITDALWMHLPVAHLAGRGIALSPAAARIANRPTLTWELSPVAVKFSKDSPLYIPLNIFPDVWGVTLKVGARQEYVKPPKQDCWWPCIISP